MDGCVLEEAAVINYMGSIGSDRAVPDFGSRSGEAGGAVSVGVVVPALEHGIDRVCSAS